MQDSCEVNVKTHIKSMQDSKQDSMQDCLAIYKKIKGVLALTS